MVKLLHATCLQTRRQQQVTWRVRGGPRKVVFIQKNHFTRLLIKSHTSAKYLSQDLDRTTQEPGHYDDYQDRHPRNGSAPCLDDAPLRAPLPPSTSRERSTARLGPHPAGARTPRRLPRPGGTELRHMPPHCSRDLGHGHGAGVLALRERCRLGTVSRPITVSRPQLYCCSSLCDFRLLSVNVSFTSVFYYVLGSSPTRKARARVRARPRLV